MRSKLMLQLLLIVAWLAMWRDISLANVVSGTLLSAAVVWLFPPANDNPVGVRPIALMRFLITTALSILRANLVVAWEVITPTNQINEGVVAVELASNNPVVITLVSHAIILAPGTMVIDIDKGDDDHPTQLFVHVLHLRSIDDVRQEVLDLEALALAAVSGRNDPKVLPTSDDGGAT